MNIEFENMVIDEVEILRSTIQPFINLCDSNQKLTKLPTTGGIYSFCWHNKTAEDRKTLVSLNRTVLLKGKVLKAGKAKVETTYYTHKIAWDWNLDNEYVCLYVGKITNVFARVKLHLGFKTNNWYTKHGLTGYKKKKAEKHMDGHLLKWNTSCQFRAGMEHLMLNSHQHDFQKLLKTNIGLSFELQENLSLDQGMTKRFYLEDLAIGVFKPWFNLDSER